MAIARGGVNLVTFVWLACHKGGRKGKEEGEKKGGRKGGRGTR